ncbi:uncharacterized protein MELLADRAFT_113195 [Melampsora larici-populina 98AG31]|uniref:Uncharacterized protein n=1 Tax=Melampsora larici-populina (strain 98AG31 / pathotype 3-4-7) TaxID=747676 RepID=F4S930_MELLP|nr:uncharacterized protein MELLADRAFT_113195 [Melampsora larici-populina 98AG31]EGF98858.1 hypothetical protein MELLADRAFT_113195 [Melampsora larici-populina 98AG31]
MARNKYLEHIGKVTVSHELGPEKGTIEFKPGTTFGGEGLRKRVEIQVMNDDGEVQATVVAKWDSGLVQSDTDEWVFEANPMPEFPLDYYGFSQFAIKLNKITEDLRPESRLAPTDSRLRPDQLLIEEGKIDKAAAFPGSEDWIYKGGYFENIEKTKPE